MGIKWVSIYKCVGTVLAWYIESAIVAGEMAQWVKGLAAAPDDLSSSLGIHMVDLENQLTKVSLNFHMWVCTHIHTHTL